MRTLIFLRAPRRNKVFPNHSQSSWGHGKSSWGHSQSHSRDLPNQNQSSRGLPDQDQPQHFRAGGEWPAHQARYQLLKIIKSKIIQDIPRLFFYIYIYQNCQGRSQFLEVEVLHRQKEEQGDEPPLTSAINVSYIWYITLSLFTMKLLIFSNRLVTAELQKLWKNATFWPFSPSWGIWPKWATSLRRQIILQACKFPLIYDSVSYVVESGVQWR